MAVTQTTRVVVGDLEGIAVQERIRTTSRGTKSRFTIDIQSEPLGVAVDPTMIGRPLAEAIRVALRQAIRDIAEVASSATLARRRRAVAALQRGAQWATKRYSGGRTGTKPPNQTVRLFNDSGRMADGLFVRATQDGGEGGSATFTVNVPANRLDPSEFEGGAFERMIRRLIELVPILGDAGKLGDVPGVSAVFRELPAQMITKERNDALGRMFGAGRDLASNVVELGQTVGETFEE